MNRTELLNQHIGVEHGKELQPIGGNGELAEVERWTIVFTDRATGDQVRIGFGRDARDEIVRQLTGGVVLAGGDLPKV